MAVKVTVTPVDGLLSSPTSAATTLNNNDAALATAIDNTLSRDGTTPNEMSADIDMNSNDLLNVGSIDANRIDADSIYIAGLPVIPGQTGGGGAPSTAVLTVAGRTGNVVLTKVDVGLSNVDNTSDANKPVSTAVQAELNDRLATVNNLADLDSAPTAITNLGATVVGASLFTAVDAAGARTTLAAAPIASPNFTGTPTTTTPAPGDNTSRIPTTAFVSAAISALSSVFQAGAAILSAIVASGTTGFFVRTSGTTLAHRTFQDSPGVTYTNPDGVAGDPVVLLDGSFATLTDASTIAVDMSLSQNFQVTLTANRTLGNPSNATVGQHGFIIVNQDATGSRTLVYGGNYKGVAGAIGTLTTTANAQDVLEYRVLSATRIFLTLYKGIA